MADYGLNITIHDLDSAVQDAVHKAHREYEPKFYDWMAGEIESHVEDALDNANANTEQRLGTNEVEEMIENAINDLDFAMLVRDYGEVGDVIEEYIYNNDIVDKCWVEDELSKVHRDIRDEVLSDIRDEIGNTEALTNDVATLQAQILSMQAEIDFLHEKHVEAVNRRLATRLGNGASRATLIVRRAAALALAIIPTISWKKGK